MKTHILTCAALVSLISTGFSEEKKPLVSLSVKSHIMGTDKDNMGPRSEARSKDITLKVTIKNTSSAVLEGAELTGDVLVERSADGKERMIREVLKSVKIPKMSPNENLTIDLGKITLNQVEWRNQKFEEKLKEWKVVCKKGDENIGEAVSDENYKILVKEMKEQREKNQENIEQEVIRVRDKDDFRNNRRNLRK